MRIAEKLKLPFVYNHQTGKELLDSGEKAFIFHNIPPMTEPADLTTDLPRKNNNYSKPLLWTVLLNQFPTSGILGLEGKMREVELKTLSLKLAEAILLYKGEISLEELESLPFIDEKDARQMMDYLRRKFKLKIYGQKLSFV